MSQKMFTQLFDSISVVNHGHSTLYWLHRCRRLLYLELCYQLYSDWPEQMGIARVHRTDTHNDILIRTGDLQSTE